MIIIYETSYPHTYQPVEGSDNEETEELQFYLDDYEDEVPNHDQAENQEGEEASENEDLPQANVPHSPEPNTNTRNSRIKRKSSTLAFDVNSQDRRWTDVQQAFKA
jgi:hypothetical protein